MVVIVSLKKHNPKPSLLSCCQTLKSWNPNPLQFLFIFYLWYNFYLCLVEVTDSLKELTLILVFELLSDFEILKP